MSTTVHFNTLYDFLIKYRSKIVLYTSMATKMILLLHICCVQIVVVVIDGEVGLLNHTLLLVQLK